MDDAALREPSARQVRPGGAINHKLRELVRRNRTRMNYLEAFTQLIDDHNAGASNIDVFFNRLIVFARKLTTEEQRTIAEHLDEEELAIFDLITKLDIMLDDKEDEQCAQKSEIVYQQV